MLAEHISDEVCTLMGAFWLYLSWQSRSILMFNYRVWKIS